MVEAKKWSEEYRGWRIIFTIHVHSNTSRRKVQAEALDVKLFGLIQRRKYNEYADSWASTDDEVQDQVVDLREGVRAFIDSVEDGKNNDKLGPETTTLI